MNKPKALFMAFFEKIFNLFILNILFAISCIPVVTIFPAFIAMYSVVRDWEKNQVTEVVKPYIQAFKSNLKKGIILELQWLVMATLIYADWVFSKNLSGAIKEIDTIFLIIVTTVFLMVSLFAFPIIATYKISNKGLIVTVLKVSFKFLLTGLVMVMTAVGSGILIYLFPFCVYIIFSIYAYITYRLCNEKFKVINQVKGFV
ncbi:YesL family protein [Enterococcus massiliensis]|uniref:YesL family protein n=1 Tax=Enterococcus massiliensis TaxID=1640685 RepID=UPI00065E098A|nr:DUF624 domain-containing protein [Enterococcus massiliensis]